jgi:rhodanese-related sulfurtransferase
MDGEISADELRELLGADDPVRIVDIRSPGQFRRGHIPGSENVPFAKLTDRIDEFDGNDRVVTVCPHGQASVQAARLIGSFEGFGGRVESLETGIEGWPYELETDREGASEDPDAPDAPF